MKKIISVALVFVLVFAFAACKKKEDVSVTQETRGDINVQQVVVTEMLTDAGGEVVTEQGGDAVIVTEIHTEAITEPESLATDPAQWSQEEIVAFYKSAAVKTHPDVTSSQTMTMKKMVVNDGKGFIGGILKLAEEAIAKALAKNSTTFDGITGGFNNLAVDDAETIKAYKSGEYTVVEMTMKEQTDGTYGSMYDGTVGHAISVLGNVSTAAAEFPAFDIDFENAKISIRYSEPTVKVKINSDGIIEKGTWSYTANVDIENLKIGNNLGSITVKTADAAIFYEIKVGGGF